MTSGRSQKNGERELKGCEGGKGSSKVEGREVHEDDAKFPSEQGRVQVEAWEKCEMQRFMEVCDRFRTSYLY